MKNTIRELNIIIHEKNMQYDINNSKFKNKN